MFRISEATQPYAWGSSDALHAIFGVERDGGVLAEAWFGMHRSAPSRVVHDAGTLEALVAAAPEAALGPDVVARFGPQLPYLLKVLAAERPLSLQVHPHIDRAREGFDEEDAAGVPLDAPHRNYKDRNHKPELVFAITQFEAMCGFRAPRRAAELFAGLDAPLARRLHGLLVERPTSDGIRAAFTHLLDAATRPGPEEVAHVAAFLWAMRRYAVGLFGVLVTRSPDWSSPLGYLTAVAVYAVPVAVLAGVAWFTLRPTSATTAVAPILMADERAAEPAA